MSKQGIQIDINANNKPLKKGLDDSGKQVEGFSGKVSKLGGRLKMLAGAAAIGAVVKGLFDMAKEVGKNADRLLDLEQQTGLTTERLQEYEHVARIAGVNSETMANAVMGLTQRLARGADMSAGLKMGLEALNVEVFDAGGKMRDLGKVSEEAIEQLAQMEDITQRNVIGAQLFSGAWKDLAPIMALGKDGIEAAKKEARDLGLIMSKDALNAANDFRIEMERLDAQIQATKRDAIMGLMPLFQLVGEEMNRLVGNTKELAGEFQRLMPGISSIFSAKNLKRAWAFVSPQMAIINLLGERSRKNREIREQEEEINKSAEERAEAEREAAERQKQLLAEIEKQAAAEREAERKRRNALGDIGRLQEDLRKWEAAEIAANTEAERVRATIMINSLKEQLELLRKIAALRAWEQETGKSDFMSGMASRPVAPMPGLAAPQTLDGYEEQLKGVIESTIEARQATEDLGKEMQDMQAFAYEAGMAMGNAFGRMASEGRDATQEIIKQMLAQVVAALIRHMAMTMGPMGAVLAGAAPGLAHAMFAGIPSYATGTSNHPGGMALVGERGPELVNLPRGSSVYTNQESMGMMVGEVRFIIEGDKLLGVLRRYQGRLNHNV